MMNLKLVPIEDADIPLLQAWLNKDYILKWYQDADEWLYEVRARHGNFAFIHHFIVYEYDKPIGFCQYYDCFEAGEEWYVVDSPGSVYSIDYLIGEENYLGRGYGKAIVKALIEKLKKETTAVTLFVQPDAENTPSNKVLLACGFEYNEEKKYYKLEISK